VPRRQIWLLIAAAGCAVSAALVYLGVTLSSRVQFVDAAADHGFIGLRRPSLVPIAETVAHSVDPVPLLVIALVLMGIAVVRRRYRVAAAVAVILVGANVTTQLLKPALAHERFADWLGHGQIDPASWPSGHSTAAMALALCAVLVTPARLRSVVAALGAVFAVAIAYSLITATWTLVAIVGLREADVRWAAGTGRDAARRVREALAPPAVAAAAAVVAVTLIVVIRPGALDYMAEHPAALTGAVAIAALGAALATGLTLVLRR